MAVTMPADRNGYPPAMGRMFLVNWHVVNVRFRALMWAIAAVLALTIVIHSAPKAKPVHSRPHTVSPLAGGLRGRP